MDDDVVVSKKRWPWVAAVMGIVGAIAVAVVVAWLVLKPNAMSDERAEIAAVQAVAAIGFGVGGVGTLMLFVRRQWLQEQAHELDRERVALDRQVAERQHEREVKRAIDERHDATERRITELYMAAAEQLGHDKAPVRLAALHALDRLGQNDANHRQVIVDIWCSYLRQPFEPPARFTEPPPDNAPAPETDQDGDRNGLARPSGIDPADLEYEVRATAQRLLASHLKDPRQPADRTDEPPPVKPDGFWGPIRIDLNGATLVNADFSGCWLATGAFASTHFYGTAGFDKAWFAGGAVFRKAQFGGDAIFRKARFGKAAVFGRAQFRGAAVFRRAQFNEAAKFGEAQFGEAAVFRNVAFGGSAGFRKSQFVGDVGFHYAQFDEDAAFHETRFGKTAGFHGARFVGEVGFGEAQFERDAEFHETRFGKTASFRGTRFGKTAGFRRAQFDGHAGFRGAQFDGVTEFHSARFEMDVVFHEIRFSRVVRFTEARFGGAAVFRNAQFGGIAGFGETSFNGAVVFNEVVAVLVPDGKGSHGWPTGWDLEPDPEGKPTWGRLVKKSMPSESKLESSPNG